MRAVLLLHESAVGTELPNRDVCIHGESWRVSGLCLDMRILMPPFRLGKWTAVTCEVVRESGTNGARILRLTSELPPRVILHHQQSAAISLRFGCAEPRQTE